MALDQRIIQLYDEYTHKPLSRNEFMRQLVMLTGSTAAALSMLPQLESDYKTAEVTSVAELFTEYITYPGVQGEMKAYVARPEKKKKYATIIVIHENRGLNAHIEDVARRAASAGYLAIAPNALAPIAKPNLTEDEARQLFSTLKAEDNLENFLRCIDYLPARDDWNGKLGCVGFCWGGAMSNTLATRVNALGAAVAFYGRQPELSEVPKIKAAVQLHYAGLDERINAGMAAYEEALKTNKVTYEQYLYEGVNHAFHNDTSSARYNADAAKLAWERSLAFFEKHLK